MGWEDMLIVGITPTLRTGKTANLLIHARDEDGEHQMWSHFANERNTKDSDGNEVIDYYFSGPLYLILSAVAPSLSDLYDEYYGAIRNDDKDGFREARSALHEKTSGAAETFWAAKEAWEETKEDEAREQARGVVEEFSEALVGKVVRIDWDQTREHHRPANHPSSVRKSMHRDVDTWVGKAVSEWIEEFSSGGPRSLDQSLQDARDALEDDEQYEAEVRERDKTTSKSKAKAGGRKTKAAKGQEVPF